MLIVVLVLILGGTLFAGVFALILLDITGKDNDELEPGSPENNVETDLNSNMPRSLLASQPSPGTGFRINDPRLNVSGGEIPPIVTKEGKEAYEVTFKKGKVHPKGSNASIGLKPRDFFPSDQCRFSFKLYFDDNWPWKETSSFNVGGKLGGYSMGKERATGSHYKSNGASLRLTFKADYGAVGYLYPQLKKDHDGTASWDQLDQPEALKKVSYAAAGVHIFAPDHNPPMRFKSKQWNTVEMFVKLNTPGRSDGVLEIVVNGKRQRLDEVRYRYTSDIRLEEFSITPFFGGRDESYAPPTDMRAWYSDFAFSRT